MVQPLVTIAIPFYNNAQTILDAIRSVYAQSYSQWELILLDDGSTDGSLQLVSQIDDARVRIISDGQNKGLVYRLNQIPALANGEYLARMDGDDLMHPQRIAKQVEWLQADGSIDLLDTATVTIDTQGRPVGKRGLEPISRKPADVIKKAMLLHPAVMGRKAWFVENRYDPAYIRAEDYELWCRTYSHSRFERIREPLFFFREGHVNIANYQRSMKTLRRIFQAYGKTMLTTPATNIEILKTYLKSGLYGVFGVFNIQDRLSARRNMPLNAMEHQEAQRIIRGIRAMELPLKQDNIR